jgi:hypothetical protein
MTPLRSVIRCESWLVSSEFSETHYSPLTTHHRKSVTK